LLFHAKLYKKRLGRKKVPQKSSKSGVCEIANDLESDSDRGLPANYQLEIQAAAVAATRGTA